MATYEEDHDLPPSSISPAPPTTTRRQRLNLSDFFQRAPPPPPPTSSSLPTSTSTSPPPPAQNQAQYIDAFHLLASAFSELEMTPLMENLISTLRAEAEDPSKRSGGGVPLGWEDGLERVGRKELVRLEEKGEGKGEGKGVCPICNERFLDDPYPLVVRLPCHPTHIFDLECIQPWLKLHTTCPLDRAQLVKEKPRPPTPQMEDDEEEWDDTYG